MSKMLNAKCWKYVGLLELIGRYFTFLFSILKIFSLQKCHFTEHKSVMRYVPRNYLSVIITSHILCKFKCTDQLQRIFNLRSSLSRRPVKEQHTEFNIESIHVYTGVCLGVKGK